MASLAPSARSCASTPARRAPPFISKDSVTSSSRQAAGKPDAASASCTLSNKLLCRHCAGNRFTATRQAWPASCQARARRHACCSTQLPIDTIKPHSSATAMKRSGGNTPSCGWRQRNSASAPTICPLATSSTGWNSSTNSSRPSAARKPCSRLARSTICAFISALKNWKLLRPLSLAWYMAISALCTRVSMLSPSLGKMATPIEVDTCSSYSPS